MRSSSWREVIVLAACASLAVAGALLADTETHPAAQEQTVQQPELQKVVSALSGKWSITQRFLVPRGHSDPVVEYGEEIWKSSVGGLTFIEENRTKAASGDEFEIAFIWWDGKAKKIRGSWCADINDEGCNPFEVHLDGDRIVMAGEWEMSGDRMAWKEVFTMAGRDSFTQVLSFGPPGGTLVPGTEIQAKRAAEKSRGN
jgi:hypothetical protein